MTKSTDRFERALQVCKCKYPLNLSQLNRRSFLQTALWGGAIASLSLPISSPAMAAEHQAKALVLSCIDFRFIASEQAFLSLHHLQQAYDWVALAGASLAIDGFPHAAEAEAFWDQLNLSKEIHQIKTIMIFDHQDCGAYASKFSPAINRDSDSEKKIHVKYLNQAYQQIKNRHPDLNVELYFILANGDFDQVIPC